MDADGSLRVQTHEAGRHGLLPASQAKDEQGMSWKVRLRRGVVDAMYYG